MCGLGDDCGGANRNFAAWFLQEVFLLLFLFSTTVTATTHHKITNIGGFSLNLTETSYRGIGTHYMQNDEVSHRILLSSPSSGPATQQQNSSDPTLVQQNFNSTTSPGLPVFLFLLDTDLDIDKFYDSVFLPTLALEMNRQGFLSAVPLYANNDFCLSMPCRQRSQFEVWTYQGNAAFGKPVRNYYACERSWKEHFRELISLDKAGAARVHNQERVEGLARAVGAVCGLAEADCRKGLAVMGHGHGRGCIVTVFLREDRAAKGEGVLTGGQGVGVLCGGWDYE